MAGERGIGAVVWGVLAGRPVTTETIMRHLSISGRLPGAFAEIVGIAAIARAAIEMGIRVPDEALQAAADDFRQAAGLFKAEDCARYFEERGWRLEDFEAHLERSLVRAAVREKVVPLDRVEARFRERRPELRLYAASQISVESLDKSRELLAQVREGEIDFAAAARKHSREALTAPGGGYIGWLRPAQFPVEARGALHGAKAGDLLGPYEIPGGATIIRIEAIREPDLSQALGEEIAEELFAEWLDERVRALDAYLVQPVAPAPAAASAAAPATASAPVPAPTQ